MNNPRETTSTEDRTVTEPQTPRLDQLEMITPDVPAMATLSVNEFAALLGDVTRAAATILTAITAMTTALEKVVQQAREDRSDLLLGMSEEDRHGEA